jgi:hypothetical protein
MLPIPDKSMDVSIGDSEVRTLLMRTGKAVSVHSLGRSPPAFHLTPGARLPQVQVSHWRRRGDRWDNPGHHTEFCVKQRRGFEVEQRGYYRHRWFLCFSRKEKALPVPKNKPTTWSSEGSTSQSSSPLVPEQEEFRQHLRRLAVSAVQVLLEQVMREELEQCLGASWGECTPSRRGYRNGSYTRDLLTPTGRIEDLKVPRDRAGAFHTQVFERYSRYEPEVAEALTDMFISGTSTKTSRQSGGKTAGSGSQCERRQSAQSGSD